MFSSKFWSPTHRSESEKMNGSVSEQFVGLKADQRRPATGQISAEGKFVDFQENDLIMGEDSSIDRISVLENELFEYQYNMGLLLIEKKDWGSKYEEIKEASIELADKLKREQEAHSIAMSEMEKQEEKLKKALGVERQCVLELEKALREIRSEYAEIKFNADSKLAEANALVASVEEKSWEVDAKLHSADTKLSEVSRRSSEIERNFRELEAQETVLQNEQISFATECETHEIAFSIKKEDLREWEKKLRELEERLADGRRLLNQREERANENDKFLKKKYNELEELQKRVEMDCSSMKSKEDDISTRLSNLAIKENEADGIQKSLEVKKAQLRELEERLNSRERLEIQKLLDEHETILAKKCKEFELEMNQKRGLQDEQLKDKIVEVENKEIEIMHLMEKVKKREHAIETKLEKVKQKEMNSESKSKALKEKEKLLKVDEKSLEKDREQMLKEKTGLLSWKAELEGLKADIEEKQQRLNQEREQLELSKDERLEHDRLRSELKKEIEKCRLQSEQLTKEADELKQEKENFEKEWEELDVKRTEIKRELDDTRDQRKYLEKFRHSEEEKLNNEKQETQQYIQREMESLKLAKDNFDSNMELEKSMLAEKLHSEMSKLLLDFELQKQELETEMQRKQEEMESNLLFRENMFEQKRETELNNISYLRETTSREMEEMKLERLQIDQEKLEISQVKKNVERQLLEMQKDIEELVGLNQKVKNQREDFVKERAQFITFAQKHKSCNICGDRICEFMLSELQPLTELINMKISPHQRVAGNCLDAAECTSERLSHGLSTLLVNSESPARVNGTVSWFKKCTSMIFKFSPGKKLELDSPPDTLEVSSIPGEQFDVHSPKNTLEVLSLPGDQVDILSPKTLSSNEKGFEPSLQVANDSFNAQITESDGDMGELDAVPAPSVEQNVLDIADDFQNTDLNTQRGRFKRGKHKASGTNAAKTVTAAVKGIGGRSSENVNQYITGDAEHSADINMENHAVSDHIGIPNNRRKRNHSHVSQEIVSDRNHEGGPDSVKDGDRVRRRQKVVAGQHNIVETRYKLRQSQKSVIRVSNGSLSKVRKRKKKQTDGPVSEKAQFHGFENISLDNAEILGDAIEPARSTEDGHKEIQFGFEKIPLENVDVGGASREEIQESGAAVGVVFGDDIDLVRSTNDTVDCPANNLERFKNSDNARNGHEESADAPSTDMVSNEDANRSIEAQDYCDKGDTYDEYVELTNTSMVGVVAGARNHDNEESNGVNHEEQDEYDSDDGDDDEFDHPGEVTIGKKVWKFLTT